MKNMVDGMLWEDETAGEEADCVLCFCRSRYLSIWDIKKEME
jgi:hypothetical protein